MIKQTTAYGVLTAAVLLATPTPARADLDVVFALDTTSSMGRELDEAKTRVQQIAKALQASRTQEKIRYGVIAFRDKGDAYVTKRLPLTDRVDEVETYISKLHPGGGGDGPEHVLAALAVAIRKTDWGPGDRQVFIVGDAQPHFDYGEPSLDTLVAEAKKKKIVVNTIGCRSLSSVGVEAFRTMAYETEGAYQHIGRVAVGKEDTGLATAVLRSLGSDVEPDGPVVPVAVAVRETRPSQGMHLEVTPIVASGEICALDVEVPHGMKLPRRPTVTRGRSLHVHLDPPRAKRARAHRVRYAIDPCVPSTLPLKVDFGG
jgi:uncharacterized protein YegL